MALTNSFAKASSAVLQGQISGKALNIGTTLGPASYVNGTGFDADPETDFGLDAGSVVYAAVESSSPAQHARFDPATKKVKVYDEAGVEIVNTTDLQAFTYTLTAHSE